MKDLILSATTIIGDDVVNYDGENLGKVKEIMLDTNTGEVAYVVVSFEGFLGMGDKLFAVPLKAFEIDTANKQFKLNKSKEELKNAPKLDKNNWPETTLDYW
ncbi:PRC-barrel domain-containing protein [Francisella hispaniensis]|uniref:Antigen n=1 Tax=Francisella hispaniensis TaxID=622488 RepID=F4BKA9_9GAMM|nr:PRC-barrel domain-containing protein [Francisella hispaniensis]AEB28603.1 antigen [Francisella hispaniensis]